MLLVKRKDQFGPWRGFCLLRQLMEVKNCQGEHLAFLSRLLDASIMDSHQVPPTDPPHLNVVGQEFRLKLAGTCSEGEGRVRALRAGCLLSVWVSLTRGSHHTSGLPLGSWQASLSSPVSA